MALPQGIDFRATSGYVTDPANCTYAIASGITYPTTTPQGNTVGSESSGWGGNNRDRNSSIDARLAGTNFGLAAGDTYRIDLPASGSYNVRIAAGDYGGYGSACAFDLYDGSTNLHSLTTGSTSAAQRWKDAQNVEYNATTWPSSNSPYTATFSTTILRIKSTNTAAISHLYVEAASGGGATATPSGVSAASAIGTPVAIGSATASPAGVSATSAIGTPVATDAVIVTPTGVQAASAIGTPTASGSATASPAGVQTASAIGTPTGVGAANAFPSGVQATSSIGTPVATGSGASATASPAGVQATSSIGMPVAGGGATAYLAGVLAASAVGIPRPVAQPQVFGEPMISTSAPRNWTAASQARNWTSRSAPRNWTTSKD